MKDELFQKYPGLSIYSCKTILKQILQDEHGRNIRVRLEVSNYLFLIRFFPFFFSLSYIFYISLTFMSLNFFCCILICRFITFILELFLSIRFLFIFCFSLLGTFFFYSTFFLYSFLSLSHFLTLHHCYIVSFLVLSYYLYFSMD